MYKSKELESTFVEIVYAKKNIIVGCVYKLPKMCIDNFNNDFLYPLLDKVNKEKKTLLLMGDFNINLLNSNNDNLVSNFLDIFGSFSLLPKIILPTRVSNTSKTLIDNIFYDSSNSKTISGNLTCNISDHYPQFLMLKNIYPNKKIKHNLHQRKWNKFDQAEFILDFFEIDWDSTLKLDKKNIDLSFQNFYSKIDRLVEKHAPLQKLTQKQVKTLCKSWITKGIQIAIHKRNKLQKLFLNSKDPNLKKSYNLEFKKYRNMIVSLTRRSKKNHFSSYFQDNIHNLKKIWQGINSIIASRKSKSCSVSSIYVNENRDISSDPITISNKFNEYFFNVAKIARSKIPYSSKHFSGFLKNSNDKTFFISPTDETEIITCISSLNSNKSSGPYSIPIKILQLIKKDIAKPLSQLINLSFSTGHFPSNLKTAQVIPIFKKDSPLECSNYRPISLLSNIDKIFEKLMYSRVIKFLEKSHCIYPLQFGLS